MDFIISFTEHDLSVQSNQIQNDYTKFSNSSNLGLSRTVDMKMFGSILRKVQLFEV